jgi:Na+/citrate or Na+/malate symporter
MSTATSRDDTKFSIAAVVAALAVVVGVIAGAYFIGYGLGKAEVEGKVCESQGGTYSQRVGCYKPVELEF